MMVHLHRRFVGRREAVCLAMHDAVTKTAGETIEQDGGDQHPGKRSKMGSN
ncbi:hypothetical protein [Pseudomonas luteola]|uniref:Uncharacterized protein n=1 Tax=Pseudomonas luteola TaxID=47886 RepID=A0ABS0FLL9_PSELU|nr:MULTISPECIES: hypothetical protein [Pseudomonas]MBF8641253.1 hypothetical protein [Pseudomonas zeshuii]